MELSGHYETAILVFANSSQEELRHKDIANGAMLFDELTQHTLKKVRKTGLPYFHFSERQQYGDSFGERFVSAIQAVFDKGYENIITLGNDTPQLKVSHILKAHQQLKSKKIVLGPSADGGFYLMALNRLQFCSTEFKNLAWQTSGLVKEISNLMTFSGIEVIRLPTLLDLDNTTDLRIFVDSFQGVLHRLLSIILDLLKLKEGIIDSISSDTHSFFHNNFYNKGSPPAVLHH